MKLHVGMMVMALGLLGACDKKAEPSPAAQVPAAEQVKAEAEKAPTAAVPVNQAPTEAEKAAAAKAAEEAGIPSNCDVKIKGEAGCPSHEAKAAEGEGCPFHEAKPAADGAVTNCDVKVKGEEGCPFHEAKTAEAQPAAAGAELGCNGKPMVDAVPTQAGGIHYGTAFTQAEAKPLSQVVAGTQDGQELDVRVSGTIEKVCQKKGCWLIIKDGEHQARVVMKNAAFTVPLDSAGKPAQVEGSLKVRVFTEAQAKHLAEDGGEDPTKVVGERRELLFQATAVEIGG